jgi:hypothetical protein
LGLCASKGHDWLIPVEEYISDKNLAQIFAAPSSIIFKLQVVGERGHNGDTVPVE